MRRIVAIILCFLLLATLAGSVYAQVTPTVSMQTKQQNSTLPWWVLGLTALICAGAGIVTAVLLIRKNKK